MAEVVGIRFKENGKVYFFDPCGKEFSKGEKVIVEIVEGNENNVLRLKSTASNPALLEKKRLQYRNGTSGRQTILLM